MKKIIFFSSGRADLAFIYKLFAQFEKKKKYKINVFLNDYSEVDFNFLKKNRLLKIKLNKVNTNRYNLISHIGNLLKKYSKILSKTKPDYLFIIGDRYEAFAMAIACNFLNIRIIHIAGEISQEDLMTMR